MSYSPVQGLLGQIPGLRMIVLVKLQFCERKRKEKKKVLDLMQALRMIAVTSGSTNSISLHGAKVMQPFLLSFP